MSAVSAKTRIAFYTHGYWSGDAIGRALRHKADALSGRETARHYDFRIFCAESDMANPRIRPMHPQRLASDEFFRSADLHIFEFGWRYELFDAIHFCPAGSRTLVSYHGVTPVNICPDPDGARASLRQKANLLKADGVLCASPYSFGDLVDFGVPTARIKLLPLPLPRSLAPAVMPEKAKEGPVELLHIGRLVAHKGAFDLLRALTFIGNPPPMRLRIVGYGEAAYRDQLTDFIARNGLGDVVEIVGALRDDASVSAHYARADAVILPSYHDSYCLPVIEAFAHGCHVIAYDTTNIPNIAGGLAMLVPTGDVGALSRAISEFADAATVARRGGIPPVIATAGGRVSFGEHRRRLAAHVGQFDHRLFAARFLAELEALLDRPRAAPVRPASPAPAI
jgi:glycosyltransferase involved in cell wall biosynthesis